MAKAQNRAAAQPVDAEIDEVTEVAPKAKKQIVDGKTGLMFKKLKTVTVPVLKLMPDAPVYIQPTKAMYIGKEMPAKAGSKPMEPATLLEVIDLSTENEGIVIVGAVLRGIISEAYPDESYVGKMFELVNHGKRGDKKYNSYSLTEVELE